MNPPPEAAWWLSGESGPGKPPFGLQSLSPAIYAYTAYEDVFS